MPAPWVESLLSLAFPAACEICGAPAPVYPVTGVCGRCESGIVLIPGPHCVSCGRGLKTETDRCSECWDKHFHFDRAFSCTPYEGKMKKLLHTYKFEGQKYLKHYFLKIMQKFMEVSMDDLAWDAVAAVPLDPAKKRARGFNQSELLSAGISAWRRLPDLSKHLKRRYAHEPQHRMAKSAREQNVKGCFTVTNAEAFKLKRILLVDDILTTGQTTSECARTLKESGASSVIVLACARGI